MSFVKILVSVFFTTLFLCLMARADDPWIPNLAKVEPGIFRGMSPPNQCAILHLKELGIKTIIDLEDQPKKVADEKIIAEGAGIKLLSIPLPPLSAPKDEDVSKILALLTDASNQPVYLHCQYGHDRTGVIIGLYRVEYQQWTPDKAFQEMEDHEFSKFQVLMKKYFFQRAGKHVPSGTGSP